MEMNNHAHPLYQIIIWIENMVLTIIVSFPVLLIFLISGNSGGFSLILYFWVGFGLTNIFFSYLMWYCYTFTINDEWLKVYNLTKKTSIALHEIKDLQYCPMLFGLYNVKVLFIKNNSTGLSPKMDSIDIIGVKDPYEILRILDDRRT